MSNGAKGNRDSICSAPKGMKYKNLMKEQVRQTVFTRHSPENKDESTFNYSMTQVAPYQWPLNAVLTFSLIYCVWTTCCVFEL